ncbi:MAG: hypothetical protein GX856_08790 [Gammaproteobacteria bacterium]|nr:hypothetical protein [Gammaproteobacteria bacterium]
MAAKATGKTPELLKDQPQPPPEFGHCISHAGLFPSPIDWAAFEAHARMTRRTFARWELDVIAHFDRMRLQ